MVNNNNDHAFLRKSFEDSLDRYKTLLYESIDAMAEDLARTVAEASTQDKKASFRLTHTLTVDLDKGISTDTLTWSVTRRGSLSSPTPSKDDLTKRSAAEDALWDGSKETESAEADEVDD